MPTPYNACAPQKHPPSRSTLNTKPRDKIQTLTTEYLSQPLDWRLDTSDDEDELPRNRLNMCLNTGGEDEEEEPIQFTWAGEMDRAWRSVYNQNAPKCLSQKPSAGGTTQEPDPVLRKLWRDVLVTGADRVLYSCCKSSFVSFDLWNGDLLKDGQRWGKSVEDHIVGSAVYQTAFGTSFKPQLVMVEEKVSGGKGRMGETCESLTHPNPIRMAHVSPLPTHFIFLVQLIKPNFVLKHRTLYFSMRGL